MVCGYKQGGKGMLGICIGVVLFVMVCILMKKEDTQNKYALEVRRKKAIQYRNTKYCESIMVQQIADPCGVDRAYLSKIFKYATGKTLQEYLIQFRIKRAKQLLKDTDLSVKYVSYSVGYNDPFTFSKVFKKQEGVSPSVWRKNHNNFA